MWAARHAHQAVVEHLLTRGLDLSPRDADGLTAQDHAGDHLELKARWGPPAVYPSLNMFSFSPLAAQGLWGAYHAQQAGGDIFPPNLSIMFRMDVSGRVVAAPAGRLRRRAARRGTTCRIAETLRRTLGAER